MRTKIIEVDFAQPLNPIYVDPLYDRLFIVVFWQYLPLGILRFPFEDATRTLEIGHLKHEIIHNFGWRLWEYRIAGKLDALNKLEAEHLPPISVVVCTRDRALSLERCLDALKKLDYPEYEVVVVDNGSTDKRVADVVKKSGFRYAREETPGLDWARNCAYKAARYDIVAYIDDDALATPGWLRGIAFAFADPTVMVVTGMVLAAELETEAQHYFEGYGGMSKGFNGQTIQKKHLRRHKLYWPSNWGVGANMAFRRRIFDQVGDFDVALDVGTATNGGGDIEFFYRAVAAGHALRYEPAAIVYHVHRRDTTSLKQQIYNNGRAFPAFLLTIIRNEPHKRLQILHFALRWWLWDWVIKQLFYGITKSDHRWVLPFAWSEFRGSFSSFYSYWKAQRVAKHLKMKRLKTMTANNR